MPQQPKFETLFQESLDDLYDAEKQIVAALPKLIAASSSPKLAEALQAHLDETRQHVTRLENIFERTAVEAGSRECKPIQAILDEGERLIEAFTKSSVLDAAIAAAG